MRSRRTNLILVLVAAVVPAIVALLLFRPSVVGPTASASGSPGTRQPASQPQGFVP